MAWRFPIVQSRPEPPGLFAYLHMQGLRLSISADRLIAEVPTATAAQEDTDEIEELVRRYAGSLALSVRHPRAFREHHSPRQVVDELLRLSAGTSAGAVLDATGGLLSLTTLLGRKEWTGADLDLACLACYRGQVAEQLRKATLQDLFGDGEP